MQWIFGIAGSLVFAALLFAAGISFREDESRAGRLFMVFAFLFSTPYFLFALKPEIISTLIIVFLLIFPLLGIIVLLLPYDPASKKIALSTTPTLRYDERDIMFSRRRLKPGSERFEAYYRNHPQKKKIDDAWRRKPGLLNPKSRFYHPLYFSAAEASFDTVEYFHPHVRPNPSAEKKVIEPTVATAFIKDWLTRSGAHSVGVTLLRDYHLYSHRGRQEPYGAEIYREHEFAIAFTVEMNKTMVDFAPKSPTILESADQYLRAGMLAVKLTQFIGRLGYEARAHIDGNYQVVCPLVARDAGLGELGRMGLLMTPELGPRVRIGVVTTDLPLATDRYQPDRSVIDFCRKCKKCAESCPAKAIPYEDRQYDAVGLRWKINHEACFSYWCTVGTDCARCIKVCPYSHPDNIMHGLVRTLIKRNVVARYLALKMDDVLYGRSNRGKNP
ncbi:4Fe-4S dicluster domain-containing protein [Calditrichota bacterium GD2]